MFCNRSATDAAKHPALFGKPWGVATAALLAGTILQVQDHGGGWLALGFKLMPDLGLIAGIYRGLQKGRLAPRAASIHKALHRFVGPAVLALLVIAGMLQALWLSAALGWALHIAVDRTVGYWLRGPGGFLHS